MYVIVYLIVCFDDMIRYYEFGFDDFFYVVKFWDCCGLEDFVLVGCKIFFYVFYDDVE